MTVGIVWIKDDFRLENNSALIHASKNHDTVSAIYIFNKELKKPEDKKMPFFSLVGISTKDNWLCARGRGGGLAIWVKS